MTIRLYSLRGSVGRRRFPRWQSFGLGEGTTDSPLRYLDEETHRQRVYTQPVARWAQTPLPPDANGHLPAQNGHRWVHLIPHPARETELASSARLRDGSEAWPRSICSQAGQCWSSGVLVAGSALESRRARASQLHTCDDMTTLLDQGQAQSAAGIAGSWSVE